MSNRCGYHVWPDAGDRRGERCILPEDHSCDHEFHYAAEKRIAQAAMGNRRRLRMDESIRYELREPHIV